MVLRHARLALLAIITAGGCRAAGVNALAPPEPMAPRASPTTTSLVSRINHNARQVRSLKATPSITVYAGERNNGAGVGGRLAMERDRNFKLELVRPGITQTPVADIGSNDQGFWFWAESKEKEVYVCNYDESGKSPLSMAFQPDWIVEALGLREIPEDEAAGITAEHGSGQDAGALILTQRRKASNGAIYTKEMVVDPAKGLAWEHRLYEGDRKTLLARAVILPDRNNIRYEKHPVGPDPGQNGAETVILPKTVQLEWVKERLKLIVKLRETEINPVLDSELFERPPFEGYVRINIGERDGLADRSRPMTIRETRPVPPSGVRLDDPVPVGPDRTSFAPDDPRPLEPDLPALADRVVSRRWPTASVPEALRSEATTGGWAAARGYEP